MHRSLACSSADYIQRQKLFFAQNLSKVSISQKPHRFALELAKQEVDRRMTMTSLRTKGTKTLHHHQREPSLLHAGNSPFFVDRGFDYISNRLKIGFTSGDCVQFSGVFFKHCFKCLSLPCII